MARSTGAGRAARVAVLGAAAAFVLTGCSTFDDLFGDGEEELQRDEETGEVSEVVEGASIFEIEEGDCLGPFPEGLVNEIDIYPCDEPHEQQVLSITQIESEGFPDEETVRDQAADDCLPVFEEFVGLAFEESELEIDFLSPSEESWEEEDDRDLVCTVYDPSGPVETSLEGASR